ncbi:outer membrane protein with beta-barrel domain [Chitinophaga skermanii]|uniref:Outer membrane protein with beta-barrel domain n=1 Tax=Chitinophaga skermanii TaxID=331697 RepID=A0A327QHG6_9BACT|nr:outer membrane beta-barrel protein [Chitinophaga skermanii]RAJ03840.1 outer membrane protein with beta-barrel domain [Chitinophaga skermanii]
MKCKILLVLLGLMLSYVAEAQVTSDTIQIRSLIIVRNKDTRNRNTFKMYNDTAYMRNKLKKNLHTRFFVFDIGFNNYIDRSQYGSAMVAARYPYNNYGLQGSIATTNDQTYYKYDYTGVGLNTFAPRAGSEPLTPSEFKLITGKSINVNVWLMMQRLNLRKHKLNLIYALGLEMNNYRYARNISYKPGYPTQIVRDTIDFSKNKLYTGYLSVPLMLNYNSNPARPSRAFEASFGVMGGYLVKARTKQVSEEYGKVKQNDEFNLNKWRLALTSEIGYGPVKLYGNFSLTPLHDYGLEQYPFSIGFRFNGF